MFITKKPLCTTLIPVRNTPESILTACLESLAAQTVPTEVVIIDDASSCSETKWTLLHWQLLHPEWLFLRNRFHRGVAFSRNRALKTVDTEYVAILDSDDIWEPSKLSVQLDAIQSDKADVCIAGTIIKTFPDDEFKSRELSTSGDLLNQLAVYGLSPGYLAMRTLAFNPSICGSNAMFRTHALVEFPTEYEGIDEWVALVQTIQASTRLRALSIVPTPLVKYCVRDNSYSRTNFDTLRQLAEEFRYRMCLNSPMGDVSYLRSTDVAWWAEKMSSSIDYARSSDRLPSYGGG